MGLFSTLSFEASYIFGTKILKGTRTNFCYICRIRRCFCSELSSHLGVSTVFNTRHFLAKLKLLFSYPGCEGDLGWNSLSAALCHLSTIPPGLEFLPLPLLLWPWCASFSCTLNEIFKQNIMINCIFRKLSLHLIQCLQYINTVHEEIFPLALI